MQRKWFSVVLAGWVMVGCGARRHDPAGALDAPSRADYRLVVHFASRVPDPYYLFASDHGEYQRHRVNRRFQSMFEAYAQQTSDPTGDRVVELFVTLEELAAKFKQIGRSTPPPRRRYAVAPAVVTPSGAEGGHTARVSRASMGGGDVGGPSLNLPYEITKTLVLTVSVEIRLAGETPERQTFSAEATEIVGEMEYGDEAYNYSGVLYAVITNAIVEIDRRIDAALARLAAGGCARAALAAQISAPRARPAVFLARGASQQQSLAFATAHGR